MNKSFHRSPLLDKSAVIANALSNDRLDGMLLNQALCGKVTSGPSMISTVKTQKKNSGGRVTLRPRRLCRLVLLISRSTHAHSRTHPVHTHSKSHSANEKQHPAPPPSPHPPSARRLSTLDTIEMMKHRLEKLFVDLTTVFT